MSKKYPELARVEHDFPDLYCPQCGIGLGDFEDDIGPESKEYLRCQACDHIFPIMITTRTTFHILKDTDD